MGSSTSLINVRSSFSHHFIVPGINKYALIYHSFPTIVDEDINQVIGCFALGIQALDESVPYQIRLNNLFN